MSSTARDICAPSGRDAPGLVTYVTAGDPDLDRTAGILRALDRAGADVIEVGVPFSDPLADGPVIQRATERALAAGTRCGGARPARARCAAILEAPLVIFSYANPILRLGAERFADRARRRGVDGVLVLDLPIEEAGRVPRHADADAGLIQFSCSVPTTTDERLRKAAALGSGFLYAISRLGVTGARDQLADGRARRWCSASERSATCPWRSASAFRSRSTCARSASGPTPPSSAARWSNVIAEAGALDDLEYPGRGVCALAEVLSIEELREPHRRHRRSARAPAERARGVRRGSRAAEARAGLPIYQPEREAQVLTKVRQSATELRRPADGRSGRADFRTRHRRGAARRARVRFDAVNGSRSLRIGE